MIESTIGTDTCEPLELRNQARYRDDPPRCGNCEQMELRIKAIEDQLEELRGYLGVVRDFRRSGVGT